MADTTEMIDDEDQDEDTSSGDSLVTLQVPQAYEGAMLAVAKVIDAVKPGCSLEEFDKAAGFVDSLGKLAKAAKKSFDVNAKGKLETDGGIQLGEVSWYLDEAEKKKCLGAAMAFRAMVEEAKGDEDAVLDCLVAQAFKFAKVKKLFPQSFAKHFKVEKVIDVKTDRPKIEVKKLNPRFIK